MSYKWSILQQYVRIRTYLLTYHHPPCDCRFWTRYRIPARTACSQNNLPRVAFSGPFVPLSYPACPANSPPFRPWNQFHESWTGRPEGGCSCIIRGPNFCRKRMGSAGVRGGHSEMQRNRIPKRGVAFFAEKFTAESSCPIESNLDLLYQPVQWLMISASFLVSSQNII